ncbi:M14 family metallopeptidase [Algibacter sp. 2305UL17-15]|uniref:M14 family metallopeptidase n=1 Tax=Algibacter sp. 2305UL17-15 TaxID=3231268 RepID=UPI003458329F
MKNLSCVLILVILGFSCAEKKSANTVHFDSNFAGARLDSVSNSGNETYVAYISPAFEPVNKSPYYAFSISSEIEKTIEVQLNYGAYKHRYIPKLSMDKSSWKKIDAKNIKLDTIKGTATLKLDVSKQKLYVSAQEIETSKDTYAWVDRLVAKHSNLKKVVGGKTANGNNNYCMELENSKIKRAVVLIARQHPPETPGGTIGFKAFYEALLSNSDDAEAFRNNFNLYAFPLLNPDGADMGHWRHNANGKDLNRDWIEFTQPETKMVKTYLEKKVLEGQSIAFGIDFHTSYSGPYLLILDSINESKTKGIIPKWVENIEKHSDFEVETRRRSQELPYCYNYIYNQFGAEAVTYEEGDEIHRTLVKKRARVYANQLMKTLLKNNETHALQN